MGIIFIGLDGEMTGGDVKQHELIQIGVAISHDRIFSSRIGWQQFNFSQEALDVIGVQVDEIKQGPSAQIVDQALVEWVQAQNVEEHSLIPVGWAVATFDRPFIAKTLPKFYRYLHHHSVDLNSVVYTFGDIVPYINKRPDSSIWKKMAKEAAYYFLLCEEARKPKPHDAGDDALLSLLSWRWLRNVLVDFRANDLHVEKAEITLYGPITGVDATRGPCSRT